MAYMNELPLTGSRNPRSITDRAHGQFKSKVPAGSTVSRTATPADDEEFLI
jgi:hypothetical protein